MKKTLTLLFLLPFFVYAQTNYLALSSNDELNSFGTLIEITNDVPQTMYTFIDNGAPPYDNLVEIGGKIYGLTASEGYLGRGSLYQYDYTNETFDILQFFETVGTTSTNYITNLCTDGIKIYGLQTQFFSGTSIIEYDVATQTITSLVSLSSIGVSDVKDLIYASNNKIYGIQRPTGSTNILFSYDLTTGVLATEHTFNTSSGDWCYSLMEHSNGNIYGATTYGGANNQGVIFEFDTTSNTYTVLFNQTATEKADNLIEGNANMLYGIVRPQSGANARIYQFDLNSNTFNNLSFFPNGLQPEGNDAWFRDFNPLFFEADILYGYSPLSNNEQLFYTYDITNNTLISSTGNNINTPFLKTSDNRIVYGKSGGNGTLMEYDSSTQTSSELNEVDFGTDGKSPQRIIKASSGLVYGVTADNFITTYDDKLFSYDTTTNEYAVRIDFTTLPLNYGNNPVNLIETTNGLIYIYTAFRGFGGGQGSLVEYDPSNETHTLAHEFGDLFDGATIGEFVELFEQDNIIYGVKRWGGNNVLYKGTIFSYNTLTHTYTVLYESDDLEKNVASILTSQGILYGTTASGGTNDEGFIYSYNVQTSQFNIIENVTLSSRSDFVELDNGDVYGVLQNSHGTDGSIFKIDGTTGAFSTYYQFDNATLGTGKNPTAIHVIDNNLYVESQTAFSLTGGAHLSNYFTEFKIDTNTTTVLLNGTSNKMEYKNVSIMNDDRLLVASYSNATTPLRLMSFTQGDTSMENVFDYDTTTNTTFSIIDLNDTPLSLQELENDMQVSIYPNPTTDYLNIRSELEINTIEVYSLQGQKIASFKNENSIDVKQLSHGMYFLKLTDNFNRTQTIKFIKR